MGFFKDLKHLHDTGQELQKASGRRGGLGGLKDAVADSSQMLQGLQQSSANGQRLLISGTPATGIVRAIRDTGMLVNYQPQIEMDLEVTLPGQAAYPVTHRQVVNPIHMPAVQPGCAVALRVDPADANQVLVLGV